eukprot:Blabericola_migrator_1__2058@NODE_1565_length_4265_cov_230_721772_g265_i3_p2_GENE_NODE_1565_length_4265_cov_230_721772_g265_i3NODE_1565_length_4265_cov_230_721772_g265_i3_p2_ORF_typecomplete_len189_score14_23Asp_protease_2/PF13650_6/4_9e05Asp_protease/PF09668_10/0_0062gagasp_proteas/PF13975_6/4_8e03gagasp_proteas/PF13975_6/0_025Peptidase_A2B/PF12384_8/0_065_NODE_1565_length_4265_cov_230_721772_g265_i335844150
MGNHKVVVEPHLSKVSTEVLLDKTLKDHLANVTNVVRAMLDKERKKSEDAKVRRRVITAASPKKRAAITPSAEAVTPASTTAYVEVDDEVESDGDDIAYTALSASTPRKIVTVSLLINGVMTSVCFDTGCEVDICPADVAELCHVRVDPSIPPSSIRGFGDNVTSSVFTSTICLLQLPGQRPCPCASA